MAGAGQAGGRWLAALFAGSLLLHVLVLGAGLAASADGIGSLLLRADAPSYLAVADWVLFGKPLPTVFDGRAFPGWPMAFASVYAWLPSPWVPVSAGLLLAALLPVLQFRVAGDRTSALLLLGGTPTLLMHSVLGMSEPLFLLLCLASCACFQQRRTGVAALLTGLAAWVRPTSFFLFLGQLYELWRARQFRAGARAVLLAGAGAGGMFVFNQFVYGEPLFQFGQYGSLPNVSLEHKDRLGLAAAEGGHFGLPLVHLVRASLLTDPPLWKQVFIWSHVVALLAVLVLGATRRARLQPHWGMHFVWALGTGLFVLSTGPYWAFYSFDRYAVWALPACLMLVRPWLEQKRWLPWLAVPGSLALALWGVSNGG